MPSGPKKRKLTDEASKAAEAKLTSSEPTPPASKPTKSKPAKPDWHLQLRNEAKNVLDTIATIKADMPALRLEFIKFNLALKPIGEPSYEYEDYVLEGLKQKIPTDGLLPDQAFFINLLNTSISKTALLYQKLLEESKQKSSPSTFAVLWYKDQAKPHPILCRRPASAVGLPLAVLHDVFREFRHKSTLSLDLTDSKKAEYLEVALKLSFKMSNHFTRERVRGNCFDDIIFPIIQFTSQQNIQSTKGEGYIDKCVHGDRKNLLLIREDKLELGVGGDGYMQAARYYDIYVEKLLDSSRNSSRVKAKETSQKELALGAPAFVMVLSGPTLWIAGCFYDGQSCTMEPLTPIIPMLHDESLEFPKQLAQILFALKEGMNTIGSIKLPQSIPEAIPPPNVPRIYRSFLDGSETTKLIVTERLNSNHLMFGGRRPNDKHSTLLIKLVYGDYGDEVHRVLANRQLAPHLYEVQRHSGAPSAVVMERLKKYSPSSGGWQTLLEFASDPHHWNEHQQSIHKALTNLLEILTERQFVHGDLRPNNIMISLNPDRTPLRDKNSMVMLNVVDFDSAGQQGKARYPLDLNTALDWPGRPGEIITASCDREQLKKWWTNGQEPSPRPTRARWARYEDTVMDDGEEEGEGEEEEHEEKREGEDEQVEDGVEDQNQDEEE